VVYLIKYGLKTLTAFIIIIFIILSCGCIDNDNNGSSNEKFELNIEDAEITGFLYNGLNNQTNFEFEYDYTWKNLQDSNGSLKFIVKFIKDTEVYSTWEYQLEKPEDYRGSAQGQRFGSLNGDLPTPERYKVEIYWQDELMDSIEKEYKI
jgi:hypothetical protein